MRPGGIEASLREQGLRMTRQRKILLELLEQSGAHLDADHLYRLARERDPRLNRVTVYRTLKLLKDSGLVDELDLMHHKGEAHYYETRMKQEHAHVVCLRCGRVEEFYGDPLRRMRRQIENHLGFQVVVVRTEAGGYCSHCRAVRARELDQAGYAAPARGSRRRKQ
ncbi:MAG: Fur family transcriptional regulator [Bryobacterales bacterium]|nr:Fur family transcriptional regulator [Bryobacterales bacterium]